MILKYYKCKCGQLRIETTDYIDYKNIRCEICATNPEPVRKESKDNIIINRNYIDFDDKYKHKGIYNEDDVWVKLEDSYVIHPMLYKQLEILIGKKELKNILRYGYENSEEEPFKGIGMTKFKNDINNILMYYTSWTKKRESIPFKIIIMNNKVLFHKCILIGNNDLPPKNNDDIVSLDENIKYLVNCLNTDTLETSQREYLLYKLQMAINKKTDCYLNLLNNRKPLANLIKETKKSNLNPFKSFNV